MWRSQKSCNIVGCAATATTVFAFASSRRHRVHLQSKVVNRVDEPAYGLGRPSRTSFPRFLRFLALITHHTYSPNFLSTPTQNSYLVTQPYPSSLDRANLPSRTWYSPAHFRRRSHTTQPILTHDARSSIRVLCSPCSESEGGSVWYSFPGGNRALHYLLVPSLWLTQLLSF